MTRTKLVSLPVDAEGKPYATPEMIDTYHDAFVAEGSNPISRGLDAVLAALPEAVVVGEGDFDTLRAVLEEATATLPSDTYLSHHYYAVEGYAKAILAAGYRKTVILDRSRVIEGIAKILGELDDLGRVTGALPLAQMGTPDAHRSEAEALLSRLQAETA